MMKLESVRSFSRALGAVGALAVAGAGSLAAQRRPTNPPRIAPASTPVAGDIDRRVAAVLPKVVGWRRDFHQHPELSWQETRTAGIVAAHLKALGLGCEPASEEPASSVCCGAANREAWSRCAPTWMRCR
jgi:hypothetical protein